MDPSLIDGPTLEPSVVKAAFCIFELAVHIHRLSWYTSLDRYLFNLGSKVPNCELFPCHLASCLVHE